MTKQSAKDEPESAAGAVSALEEIYPESVTVTLRSGPVTLRPLTIMEFGALNRAVRVVAAALNEGPDMLDYVQEHAADLIPFVAAASGKPAEDLTRMYGGDFLTLFIAALDANADFFGRCAALRFGTTGVRLIQLITGPGPAQSTTSADTGTPNANATP